ncbi:MAG TPA: Hsp20/alpha crystallin family protein [Candidatus Hydrogenedentes bacterium]|nr:Hsp20/alpha crystallin family protein [Candidatus Hydrogenedentota bacterium]HOL77110.1 Hsp20/alpha crystallin family protein [Candidatus Hydrogenedentota bacterium]HPO86971.1 Hsp20/alpha crystallin family protein [Candidatus Hydrogenedentota bacterium]
MKETTTVPVKAEKQVPETREETRTLTPPVDIFEIDDGLAVVVDLPGVDKSGVDIRVENNILTIKGTVDHKTAGDPVYKEFELLNYYRQFQLGEKVDQNKIHAEMKGGVLTIYLPKVEEAKPKKISVKVS